MAAWGVAQVPSVLMASRPCYCPDVQHHIQRHCVQHHGRHPLHVSHQVTGLMVLERLAEARAQPRLALDVAGAAVTLALQIVVRLDQPVIGSDRAFTHRSTSLPMLLTLEISQVLGTGGIGGLLGAVAAVVGAALLQLPSAR